jgi:hypothetical protein
MENFTQEPSAHSWQEFSLISRISIEIPERGKAVPVCWSWL